MAELGILGGSPAFVSPVLFAKPTLPPYEKVESEFRSLFESGMVTNGVKVRGFETLVRDQLHVEYAVGLGSCTSGLMLAWKALNLSPGGEVIVPSFTFPATVHALLWNGLVPRFVDIEPDTLVSAPEQVESAITPETVAIAPVHTFGNPCYPDRLEDIARRFGLRMVIDSAHGLGSSYRGQPVGRFGDVEIFSLSPTKLVVAAEGGVATTASEDLAHALAIGRDYGNPGNYDCEFAGLNARMSEFHAVLASESLQSLPRNVAQRRKLVDLYKEGLKELPGVRFQSIVPGGESSYKDVAILIDESKFGLDRDGLATSLQAENIPTRKYFHPPAHRQRAYLNVRTTQADDLQVTEQVTRAILCLPLYSHMEPVIVEGVCELIQRIHHHASTIKASLGSSSR